MDINTFRGIAAVMALIAFLGVWVWAWSKRRTASFDQAANQLLSDEEERIHQRSIEEMKR